MSTVDIDANLYQQQDIVARINGINDGLASENREYTPVELMRLAGDLAALVEAQHEWIRKGGSIPTAWKAESKWQVTV